MTQIQLDNHTYTVAYNMQAAIAYERITGKNPFDLKQFDGKRTEPLITLLYAMIAANDNEAPDFDVFLRAITDYETLSNALLVVTKEISLFFKTDEGDKDSSKELDSTNKGDDPKKG